MCQSINHQSTLPLMYFYFELLRQKCLIRYNAEELAQELHITRNKTLFFFQINSNISKLEMKMTLTTVYIYRKVCLNKFVH